MSGTENEGFWLSHQVRNGKKTAILAIMDESAKKGKKKDAKDGSKLFFVYRPNTGQQVKQETLTELKKKYKKVRTLITVWKLHIHPSLLLRLVQKTARNTGRNSSTAAPRHVHTHSGKATVEARLWGWSVRWG